MIIRAIKEYFYNIDTKTLFIVFFLSIFGVFFMFSVSPAVAYRINIGKFQIAIKHVVFIFFSLVIMIKISTMNFSSIIRMSIVCCFVLVVLLFVVLFVGSDIKGSKRWIKIPFFLTVQPSEILKPFFVVINAMFLRDIKTRFYLKIGTSFVFFAIIGFLLIKEPDFGMFCIYSIAWLLQLFIAGFSIKNMFRVFSVVIVFCVFAVYFLPHAKHRFLSWKNGGERSYQVEKAVYSMSSAGYFGKGIGNGTVKFQLPDVYTDYIFSAIGEELGYLICCFLLFVYFFLFVHNFLLATMESDLMRANIICGFMIIVCAQSFVNICVNLNLLPSKGMTLPFISYGGSALFGICIGFGIILSITSKKSGYRSILNMY